MGKRYLLIYNFAQHYRTSIFKKIDETFDIDFLFGDSMSDVKKMDYSLLNGRVTETHTRRKGRWYWQPQVVPSLFKDYSCYILLGETHAVSTWLFLLLALFFPQKKVYLWSHGWYGKETRTEGFLKKIFFHLPNGGIFLYGNYARELMIKQGFSPDRLHVIHNSLAYEEQLSLREDLRKNDIYQNHFDNNSFNLIFVGRLTKVKKLDIALHALKRCIENGCFCNLTLIGDGVAKEDLIRLSHNLGLTDRVWFYGACYDEAELGKMIYNADLCVSPGNVGLTAMHAMVFGTPVVTHNDFPHQMPEFEAIHEGITGAFFVSDSEESLAETIRNWFQNNQGRREEIRRACYDEIDSLWTPQYQIEVLQKVLI